MVPFSRDIDSKRPTSLTFLFTSLEGSTALCGRVGDLVAYDLVREHLRVLNDIVASESVVGHPRVARLIEQENTKPVEQLCGAPRRQRQDAGVSDSLKRYIFIQSPDRSNAALAR